jgi:hypothetical protein
MQSLPLIRYWKYNGTEIVHNWTTFPYGLIFKREYPKYIRKNVVILLGSNECQENDEVLLRCKLNDTPGQTGIYIKINHPNFPTISCIGIPDDKQYKQLKSTQLKNINNKITDYVNFRNTAAELRR